jgi:hypothetical protein
MDAIASIPRHEDYRIVRQEMVAGQDHPTTRVVVDMTIRGVTVMAIPFDVVQDRGGRWFVTNVDLEKVMAGG